MSEQTVLPKPQGKFKHSVSMLTWGYNEEELAGPFLEKAIALMDSNVEDFEIVFVNDASTDSTRDIVEEYAKKDSRIKLINHERNMNVGWACRTAIKNASKEYLFWETVDWSYDLSNMRIFLELLNYFDVVQGVRTPPFRILSYIPLLRTLYRIRKRSDNMKAAFVSLSNYYLIRILFGVPFQDFQNVTFYPTKLAQSADLVGVSSFINPEILIKSYAAGARFIEVPIKFIPRSAGTAKGIKLKAVARSVRDVLGNAAFWGVKLNLSMRTKRQHQIYRIMEPFYLSDEVLALVMPLFKEFRP
jgi:glycosyltransferase involved in cell wall biosynthesis